MTVAARLRAAMPADADAVVRIGFEAYCSNFDDLEPGAMADPAYRAAVRDMFARDFAAGLAAYRIAELDGVAVGFGARPPGEAHVSEMWVDPAFQGRGVGAALLASWHRPR
jgi:ribosomal-protein-alanine N-acetyltransferase